MNGVTASMGAGGERFVRKQEIADRLGVTTRTLNLWDSRGVLRLRRLSPTVVGMPESELVAFIHGRGGEGGGNGERRC